MAEKEYISGRELARRLTVSEGAVRQALKEKKLGRAFDKTKGKYDYALALKTPWAQEQLLTKPKAGVSLAKVVEKADKKTLAKKGFEAFDNNDLDDFDEAARLEEDGLAEIDLPALIAGIKITPSLAATEAARRQLIVKLALDKIELQEKEKILVRRDLVNKSLYAAADTLKKALFNMPQRIARQIMACKNEVEAINIFTDELNHILNTYCQNLDIS